MSAENVGGLPASLSMSSVSSVRQTYRGDIVMQNTALLVAFFLIGSSAEAAEMRFKACITQPGAICPSGTHARFSCGTSLPVVGETVCSIHTERGKQVYKYETKVIRDVGGGRCGTATVDVVCHGMPDDSRIEWISDNCVTGRRQMCMNNRFRIYDCGTSLQTIAQNRCMRSNGVTPFQVFTSYSGPGGRCGMAYVLVGCHVPAR